jgi:Domain of unknown function (DUF5127)
VRVDDATYSFLGDSPVANRTATLTNIVVTPTQTMVTAEAGGMEFNLTFLNPIEVRFVRVICWFNILTYTLFQPGDWVKQSIPFSYMSLTANSLDGGVHSVQMYSDISGGADDRSSAEAH